MIVSWGMRTTLAFVAIAAFSTACKKTEPNSAAAPGSAATPGTPSAPPSAPATPAPAAAGSPACLPGAWLSKVGDKNLYTFKADNTGERVHLDTDHSLFTWSMKDATTVLVVFPAHDSTRRAEFEFTVDCATSPTEVKFQGT
jgi:hypothetical protein